MLQNIVRITIRLFFIFICVMTVASISLYQGDKYVYLVFTAVFNGLLLVGFRKKRIFFDTFIGLFFWLGFWLKFSASIVFQGGGFHEFTGNFDYSGGAFDKTLLVSTVGAAGLIVASIIREKWMFVYGDGPDDNRQEYMMALYEKYRKIILVSFVMIFLALGFSNLWLGIYQRGGIPQTSLPLGLNGVYTWLLLFGMASCSAVILDCELRRKRSPYLATMISLFEIVCSNISMLSRGMVLNATSIILGVNESEKKIGSKEKNRYMIITIATALILFLCSVYVVNIFRIYRDRIHETEVNTAAAITGSYENEISLDRVSESAAKKGFVLIINRWTGIEGVMAVTSYPNLGWNLWKKAWQENYTTIGTSFYDLEIAKSRTANSEAVLKHHFITMPGILAFSYYAGSYIITLFFMIAAGILAATIEIFVHKVGGKNLILCALMAQIVASRYAHFGYAPKRTYLLVLAITLNVAAIYILNAIFENKNRKKILL